MSRSIAAKRPHSLIAALAALCLSTATLATTPARADYRLAPGDVLELAAVGVPELKQRMQLDNDGKVMLPLAGPFQAAGLTLDEVRSRIRDILPKQVFRRRNEEGREYPVILSPGDIDVTVGEYRPIFLNGDVSKPGEQPFRPGMTVRQAVSLAGGYDIMRFRMNNPFLEQSDLKSQYNSLWAEYAKEQVHVARIRAELEGKQKLDDAAVMQTPLPATVSAEFSRLGQDELRARLARFEREKAYLADAASKEEGRMGILAEQVSTEKAGVEADTADLSQLQGLLQKGSVVMSRVVDARRALLLSSTRQLETQAQLAGVERERQDFNHRASQLDDQRRLELLNDLQEANVKLATVQAKLAASSEKLVYVGMVRSQLVSRDGSKPHFAVFRKKIGGGTDQIEAAEDTDLSPGDVIDVSLQADLIPGVPAR